MILVQSFRAVLKSDQPTRCKYTDLAHSAAQALSPDASLVNKCSCAKQDRARRRAEAFRQSEHHRVAMPCQIGDGRVQSNRRVEYPRTIHMNRELNCMSTRAN